MSTRMHRLLAGLCAVLFCVAARTADAATIKLQWDANGEPDVTGYIVSYGTQSGVYETRVDVGNTTTATLNLTAPGTTTYYFAVAAYTPTQISDPSTELSTTVSNPIPRTLLYVDSPSSSQVLPPDIFISGWAADVGATSGSGVDAIHVYAYPNPGSGAPPVFLGVAAYGASRPDVAAAIGDQFINAGFTLPVVGLAPGRYDLAVFAHSTVANAFTLNKVVRFTVYPPTAPVAAPGAQLYIDTPRSGASVSGNLTVAGWAADTRGASGSGVDRVDLWAYPSPGSGTTPLFLGSARYGDDRSDVAAIFGARFKSTGFAYTVLSLPAGTYDIVAFPRSTVTGALENPRIVRITIRPSVMVNVDVPATGGRVSGPFMIAGWAIDRRATEDSGIDTLHVWAYPNPGSNTPPIFLGDTVTGIARWDVASIFGANFGFAGFSLTSRALDPGVYDVVVFGHSRATGRFETATVVRITVQ